MKTAQGKKKPKEVEGKRGRNPVGSAERRPKEERYGHFSIVLGRWTYRSGRSEEAARAEGAREPAGRSSEKERREDAKALIADEGRDKLRKAQGSRK